jgi:hypothetical protein
VRGQGRLTVEGVRRELQKREAGGEGRAGGTLGVRHNSGQIHPFIFDL